jgi:NADPH:quinone reductase-like Zn-dependent oxidoreductase
MPPQDRVRLNDAGYTEQAWPDPGHPHHQGAITAMQRPQTVWCTPQGNIELMPKKEVLQAGAATSTGWRQTSQAAEGMQASRRMMR